MNRPIKFRAWDSRFNKMLPAFGIQYEVVPDLEECTLMQFTGLLDKSGKEIYEGDILEFNRALMEDLKHQAVRDVVEFIDGCFLPRPYEREDAEIIGNIYENPELMK